MKKTALLISLLLVLALLLISQNSLKEKRGVVKRVEYSKKSTKIFLENEKEPLLAFSIILSISPKDKILYIEKAEEGANGKRRIAKKISKFQTSR